MLLFWSPETSDAFRWAAKCSAASVLSNLSFISLLMTEMRNRARDEYKISGFNEMNERAIMGKQ